LIYALNENKANLNILKKVVGVKSMERFEVDFVFFFVLTFVAMEVI